MAFTKSPWTAQFGTLGKLAVCGLNFPFALGRNRDLAFTKSPRTAQFGTLGKFAVCELSIMNS